MMDFNGDGKFDSTDLFIMANVLPKFGADDTDDRYGLTEEPEPQPADEQESED